MFNVILCSMFYCCDTIYCKNIICGRYTCCPGLRKYMKDESYILYRPAVTLTLSILNSFIKLFKSTWCNRCVKMQKFFFQIEFFLLFKRTSYFAYVLKKTNISCNSYVDKLQSNTLMTKVNIVFRPQILKIHILVGEYFRGSI